MIKLTREIYLTFDTTPDYNRVLSGWKVYEYWWFIIYYKKSIN